MELVNCITNFWEFIRVLRNDERVLDGFIESTHITEEMQKKFMINQCMDIWPTAYAKVKLGNIASDKLFLSVGFEEFKSDENFTYYRKKMTNLKSSIIKKGRYVSQILHFVGGEKRTFNNVDTHSIKQGQFTKFETKDGRLVMVNDKNILCIEIIEENEN